MVTFDYRKDFPYGIFRHAYRYGSSPIREVKKPANKKEDTMYATNETITPAAAAAILREHNGRNPRTISRDLVRRWATEMKEGRWRTSPHGLVFATDGELENGQHTLAAIVSSGLAQTLWVTRDAPVGIGEVLDQGRTRTAAQIAGTSIESDTPVSRLTSASRIVLDQGLGQTKPSNTAIVQFARAHQAVLERYASLAKSYTAGVHAAFVFAELSGFQNLEDAARRLEAMDWYKDRDDDPMRALARRLSSMGSREGARAQKMRFFTALSALAAVDQGEGLAVVHATETMPKRARKSVRSTPGSTPPPTHTEPPEELAQESQSPQGAAG
jgi:hypothetical protein